MIRILQYGQIPDEEIFARADYAANVEDAVASIIQKVREEGDEALFAFTKKFDGADLTSLKVTQEEMDEALSSEEPEFLRILERAAKNIRRFHSAQVRNSFVINAASGFVILCHFAHIVTIKQFAPADQISFHSRLLFLGFMLLYNPQFLHRRTMP